MRTKRFTFTKRVKTIHQGLEVNLTVAEAAEVSERIKLASLDEEPSCGTPEEAMDETIAELVRKLDAFVEENS